jgi:selenocysteine-specific elongation factor
MEGERVLTLGTAGHIDHGKTALVKALTGKDTDRLAEEHRRGISIELGFAELPLPGCTLSVVDVPGHERLVRTMVSGASGIDLFLLVVAADDGPMPQTHEHLTVLRALGVERGVIAVTKCDLVDGARRTEVADAARRLVPGAPVCAVSARSGEGLDELRDALERAAAATPEPPSAPQGPPPPPVLHVDRRFSLKGVGTIVTGTLRGAPLRRGDKVVVLPRGSEARVRDLQSHDRQVEPALPGSRVALNLAGVSRSEVERGDVITVAGAALAPSYRLDVELAPELASGLDGGRVQVHHGTRAVPARVVAVAADVAQLRLSRPLVAARGDRVVMRSIAPPGTLGGATVLDPAPPRHGPVATERLLLIREGRSEEPADLAATEDAARARPRAPGPAAEPGPLARHALRLLEEDGFRPRSVAALAEALGSARAAAAAALGELVAAGKATQVGPDLYFAAPALERAREAVLAAARAGGSISLAEARDALGTGRKHAQAVLEHLDAAKLTVRRGDRHVLRRAALSTDGGE